MKKKIELKTELGETLFSIKIDISKEAILKEELKAKLIYNLLFLSREYHDRDEAFDFIEFTDIDIYGNSSLVNLNTFEYIKDIAPFTEYEKNTFIDINKKFRELVSPGWDHRIISKDSEWIALRIKSQLFLKYLGVPYKNVDLDEYIEKNTILL